MASNPLKLELLVGNSYSRLSGLDTSLFKELRKLLSYTPEGLAFAGFAHPKFLIDKKGCFPSGLIPRVKKFLSDKNVSLRVIDPRLVPKPTPGMFKLQTSRTPYPDQEVAAQLAYTMPRLGIVAPTGSGKSFIIALIISKIQMRTLVVGPNLGIRDQLRADLKSMFGSLSNIEVENIDSPRLKKINDFDCLILDECHRSASATYQKLNKTQWSGIYRRYFLSATYFRNQESEQLLFEGIAGSVGYRLTYAEAVKKKYIVPVEAYYVALQKQPTDAYTWAEVFSKLVVNNTARNEIIAVLILRLYSAGKSVLCLVKEVAHGKILSTLTGLPFVQGSTDDRQAIRDFSQGKILGLIATEGIMAEGIDSRACEYVVITSLGKAKSAFQQKIGRAVRVYPGKESAKIILFDDKSHKYTHKHFLAQKKILFDEYGIVPIKLEDI